ncbi:response regulator transcription factor [Desulfoprunum benzoelyticum]|uniref:DNA-binding NarL/FixJ family response regulator n=1 Tax=Desulfoprunum benzoelyticum TaxID=1506996 RepID=A0A840USF2_9BACT|nr:response regulator transcription factor [Desulfoprunum benzoelyticum]MBB5346304.1 DNA-binding NarL/FixJ family response regulator [Desulfoprunum benzoelyticum]MBM9528697.1 response regulator transcription factor [Desulfoprunum benzoelyticum]
MKKPRILLADDHRMVAEGLRGLLESDYQLVGIVEDGRALLEAADRLMPDVVVADVSMPLLNGIEAVRQLKKKNKDVAVVFLTMHLDVAYSASAFEAGASGYVLKHSAPSELLTAISSALKGRTYITPLLAGELLNYQRNRPSGEEPGAELARLTTRQREVLQLIAEGLSVKEAATLLGISARTVEFHKYSMMETLGLKSSAELMRFAVKHGIK